MPQHMMVAIKAYLDAAGLPDLDKAAWKEARNTLLGAGADDLANVLVMTPMRSDLDLHLTGVGERLSKAGG